MQKRNSCVLILNRISGYCNYGSLNDIVLAVLTKAMKNILEKCSNWYVGILKTDQFAHLCSLIIALNGHSMGSQGSLFSGIKLIYQTVHAQIQKVLSEGVRI